MDYQKIIDSGEWEFFEKYPVYIYGLSSLKIPLDFIKKFPNLIYIDDYMYNNNISELEFLELIGSIPNNFSHSLMYLSNDIVGKEPSKKFVSKLLEHIGIEILSLCMNLSISSLLRYHHKIDWSDQISRNVNISLDKIEIFSNLINFDRLIRSRKLSKEFINKYKIKFNIDSLIYSDFLSYNFVMKNHYRLNMSMAISKLIANFVDVDLFSDIYKKFNKMLLMDEVIKVISSQIKNHKYIEDIILKNHYKILWPLLFQNDMPVEFLYKYFKEEYLSYISPYNLDKIIDKISYKLSNQAWDNLSYRGLIFGITPLKFHHKIDWEHIYRPVVSQKYWKAFIHILYIEQFNIEEIDAQLLDYVFNENRYHIPWRYLMDNNMISDDCFIKYKKEIDECLFP